MDNLTATSQQALGIEGPVTLKISNAINSQAEPQIEKITQLAARMLNCSFALINLVDRDRQWFETEYEGVEKLPKDSAFSAQTITAKTGKLVIPNALEDPKFRSHTLVKGSPFIRAYAGVTLYSAVKAPIGTLCAVDKNPRQFSGEDIQNLQLFAHLEEGALYASGIAEAAQTTERQNETSTALHFDDFVDSATSIFEADDNTEIVLGSVSLAKSKSIQNQFGDKVLIECRKELAHHILLALGDRNFLLGHSIEGFIFLIANSADIDSLTADLDLNISGRFNTTEGKVYTSVAIGLTEASAKRGGFPETLGMARVALEDAMSARDLKIRVSVYRPSMMELVRRSRIISLKLEGAIAAQEIELYFQPKVRLSDFKVVGVEALLRWQTADFGFVPPPEVIRAAEDTGSLLELEMYILESAIKTISHLHAAGIFSGKMSVNISETTLLSEGLETELKKLRLKYQLPSNSLEFEILESTLLYDIESSLERINALKLLGISFSLDDFGTGYSSLSHLNNLPVDYLKIDRSFISKIVDEQRAAAMAHQIIGIGHTMSTKVVAEGVETFDQYLILRSLGCDIVQGYFFSRAIPARALEALLLKGDSRILPPSGRTKSISIDAIDVINRVPLFQLLDEQDRTRLAANASHLRFMPSSEIVSKGSLSSSIFIVVSGVAEAYRKLANGTVLSLAKFDENSMFGDTAMLANKRRPATIRAHSECLVLKVTDKSLRKILHKKPKLAVEFSMFMAARENQTMVTD
jgi:EAL domain-containing protein (putative c-di-GMP-specific phosphodiesterase class I)